MQRWENQTKPNKPTKTPQQKLKLFSVAPVSRRGAAFPRVGCDPSFVMSLAEVTWVGRDGKEGQILAR